MNPPKLRVLVAAVLLPLSGCGALVVHAPLGSEFKPQATTPAGLTVVDRRAVGGLELQGLTPRPGLHRVEIDPLLAEATRAVLGRHLADLDACDTVQVSLLKATCVIGNNYVNASASLDFQAEAQFRVRGATYMKTLASGHAEHDFPVGVNGASPRDVCPAYLKKALESVGTQARDFYESVRQ